MKLFSPTPYSGKRVCVALSGGADSVCLLRCFLTHAAQYGITLSAVHVEHGIRGEESIADMRFCMRLCEEWGVPLKTVRIDVPELAKTRGGGLEENARLARYDVFRSLVEGGEADLVATAHHLGDVAETILFRLARGTSPAGMKAIGNFPYLVRPLLGVSRDEILSYVRENSLPYIEDSTNADERYTRNYIRHTVLPAFEKIHGNAVGHLTAFAAQCARDDEYLTELARREIVRVGEDSFVPLSLPDPLFSRACLLCLNEERDYSSAQLKEIEKLRSLQSGRKICLPHGRFAAREYEKIAFYREEPPLSEHPFTEADLRPAAERGLKADLDAFPSGCVVRSRREGDFIVPFGGHKKSLKKFLTDKKISARLGRKLPLVACGQEILVVFGVEISDRVKITEETKRVGDFGRPEI